MRKMNIERSRVVVVELNTVCFTSPVVIVKAMAKAGRGGQDIVLKARHWSLADEEIC